MLGLAGAVIVYLCTPWGLAVSFDSFAYLHVAGNVLVGRGFVLISTEGYRPMTHWPPLYPGVIALISTLRLGGPMAAARVLQAALFGANLILASMIVRRASGRWSAALAAALVLACSGDMLTIHTAAWSEPLFLLLAVGGMWALAEAVERQGGGSGDALTPLPALKLVLAAILIGLGCITRYSGVAVAIGGVIYLLLERRYRAAILFGVVAMVPLGVWLARNYALAGAGTDRHLAWHPAGVGHLRFAGSTMLFWLAPRGMPGVVRGAMLTLIAVGIALLLKFRKRQASSNQPAVQRVLGVFIVAYFAFVLLARTFLDAAIPMDARIFSPVLYSATILVAIVISRSIGLPAAAWATILALFLIPHAIQSTRFLLEMRRDGAGYSSRAWQTSPLVAYLRELPEGTRVYSNGMIPIAFLTGRWTRGIPEAGDRLTARPDPAYSANVGIMENDLRRGALLVDFKTLAPVPGGLDLPDLAHRLELRMIHHTPDGTVYAAAQRPSTVP